MARGKGTSHTDARLRALDHRLQSIFNDAYKTALERESAAIAKLAALDVDALRAQVLDDTQIRAKQLAYKRMVERETNLVNSIAAEIAKSGQTAAKMIRGEMLNVFQGNYLGALTTIDDQLGFAVNWTVYDKNQLRALLDSKEAPFTRIAYRNLGKNNTIVRRLQNELTQSVILGESIPQITRRIRGVTSQSFSQARTVARTETLRVANQGRMTGFDQAHEEYGIEMDKQWISILDDRTRDTHADMHMEKASLDDPFSNGLMQPGDPRGSPEETINCRCTIVSVLRGFKGSKAYQELNERIGKKG